MARTSIILLLITLPVGGFLYWMGKPPQPQKPFTPPTKSKRTKAIGKLTKVDSSHRQAFVESESFSELPKLQVGDWLSGPGKSDQRGQSFAQFSSGFRNKVTKGRRTIYIQPMGDFEQEEQEFIKSLRAFASAYYQLPTKVLEVVNPRELDIKQRINGQTEKPQLLSTDILDRLEASVPDDAYCVIALTLTDLYPKESWNFVFGQASLANRVGVFSLARYSPSFHGESKLDADEEKYIVRLRACKVLSHELGHMFGMQHCIYFHCDMNGANNLQQTDDSPLHLCPVCLRKTYEAIGYDPVERYRQLGKYYDQYKMESEAKWIQQRLSELEK